MKKNSSNVSFPLTLYLTLMIAFLIRLGIALAQKDNFWHSGDLDYFRIAENLVDYGEYALIPGVFTRYRMPMYPAFLALLLVLFGKNITAIILGNVCINTLVVVASYLLAKYIIDNKYKSLVAASTVAFYPYLIWQSGHSIENGLLSLLLLVFVLFVLKAAHTGKMQWVILSGLSGGLAILTKSVVIAFIPFTIAWWYLWSKKSNQPWQKNLTVFLITLGVTLLPWVVRNAVVFGNIIITESNGGMNLWKGNNLLTFTVYPQFSLDSLYAYQAQIIPTTIHTESEKEMWYLKEFKEYVLNNPAEFLTGVIRKTFYLYDWNIVPRAGHYIVTDSTSGPIITTGRERSLTEKLLYTIPYVSAGAIAIYGAYLAWNKHADAIILIALLFIAWTLVHSIVFTYSRYRMQIEPFMLIWTGFGLSDIISYLSKIIKRGK